MTCSQCQHAMIASAHGWMCLECGHLEGSKSAAKPKASKPVVVAQDTPAADKPPQAPAITTGNVMDHTAAAANVHDRPAAPASKKRVRKLAVIAAIGLLVLSAGGALAYQTIVLGPQQALPRYLGKVSGASSAQFKSTLAFSSDQAGWRDYKTNLNLSGSYDLKDKANPKMAVQLNGGIGPGQLKGEVVTADQSLFFKIESLGLLEGMGLKTDKDWYRLGLNDVNSTGKCGDALADNPGIKKLIENLPLKNPRLINLFDKVDGKTAAHYAGSIDMDQLPGVVAEANKTLSADCQLDLTAKDVAGVTFDYDLWSGNNFDRLIVVMKLDRYQATVNLAFDSFDYNRPANIKVPANARDLSEVLKAYNNAAEEKTRDSQRRQDIDAVAAALESYKAAKKGYPPGSYANLSVLVPAQMAALPQDPSTGSGYSYTPSGCSTRTKLCTGYELAANLEDSTSSGYPVYRVKK
jgi:hypothetical protein